MRQNRLNHLASSTFLGAAGPVSGIHMLNQIEHRGRIVEILPSLSPFITHEVVIEAPTMTLMVQPIPW